MRAARGPRDADVAREVDRVRKETALAHALAPARMVGYLLEIGAEAGADPACQLLLGQDFGLGAAVYPRSRAAVVPPWCLDYAFVPISEDEVEM